MSTIIIKNSNSPGNQPASLAQGELAINVTDGRLFYGDGATVQEFTTGASGSIIDTSSFATTGSNTFRGTQTVTGSVNVTGSKSQIGNSDIFGNLTITGSINITGSLNQIGDYTHTGSVYHSGSKFLTGVFSQTGSMNITGSTTQIGNNNLFGTTTLSGSIIISGSTTVPSTPTIKVYGDMETNGVIKFLAVDKNIDTTISGSYIYVSGSTNDLYFSQNGSGFNNNVRLRWIEGGALYTGLLRGGIISSTPGTTTFNITSGSGLLVTMNASTASEPYPTVQYINWPNFTAQPIQYSGSAKITYVGISSAGTVIQQTVPWGTNDINQWDNSLSLGVVLHLSGSVSTGVFNSPQISYGGQQKTDDFFRAFGPLKISGHTLRASGSSPTLSIIKDAGTSYREGANYVLNANHPSTVVENSINTSKIYRYYISGSTPVIDTGVNNAGYTEIDNKNYVDTTTGQLATVGASNWSIQRVFWIPNSPTNAFIVYYGNARYGTLLNATNAKDSEPFIEAPNTAQNAIFIGYIIIQGGGSGTPPRDLLNANEATIIPAGLFRNVGGIGSSGTNFVSTTLAGLADVSISPNPPAKGDLLVYGAAGDAQWNNAKQLTGSYGLTGSLAVTQNISAGNQIITGSVAIGTSSLGPNENTLTLGARDTTNEGAQLGFNAPGGTYTSASFLDLYQNRFRLLRGTNAGSTGEVASWNLGTLQAALPAYTSATSFPGTSVSVLGTDSGGNILTLGAWQDYTLSTNLIGITSPTNKQIQYMVLGKTMFVQVDFRCASPNGSGSFTSFTVPFNASSWSGEQRGLIQGVNNLTQVSSLWRIVAGTNVVDISATSANDTTYNGWTNATARRVVGFLMINIA